VRPRSPALLARRDEEQIVAEFEAKKAELLGRV